MSSLTAKPSIYKKTFFKTDGFWLPLLVAGQIAVGFMALYSRAFEDGGKEPMTKTQLATIGQRSDAHKFAAEALTECGSHLFASRDGCIAAVRSNAAIKGAEFAAKVDAALVDM